MALGRSGSSLYLAGGGLMRRRGGSLTFIENAVNSYEYGGMSSLPEGFGDGEFTLTIFFRCLSNATYVLGDTSVGGLAQRQRWSSADPAIYNNNDWWFYGNFLLDGHDNAAFQSGTCSVQIANGRPRWLFGDGAVELTNGTRLGNLHAVQSTATNTVLDNRWHQLDLVRRWSGVSQATLELWLDGVQQDTETSSVRTNMATTYWDGWSGVTVDDGWMFGAEKQAGLNVISQWEDFKGQLGEIRFWSVARTTGELGDPFRAVSGTESGLVGLYTFGEGSGTTIRNALTPNSTVGQITLTNSPAWSTDRLV